MTLEAEARGSEVVESKTYLSQPCLRDLRICNIASKSSIITFCVF